MKISKVNHAKTAVTTIKGIQQGIIYRDPANGRPAILSRHVEKLTERTRSLRSRRYEVFNVEKLEKKLIKELKTSYGDADDNYLKQEARESYIYKTACSINSYISENVIKRKVKKPDIYKLAANLPKTDEHTIDYLIDNAVINALSKESTRNAIKLLLSKSGEDNTARSLTQNEIDWIHSNFIKVMWDDCECRNVGANAVKGIEHQNLVIQPVGLKDKVIFAPSIIKNQSSSKSKRKEAFRSMLTDYAVIDEARRMDMLAKLRRINVLYFYGSDEIPQEDFNIWKDHFDKRLSLDVFVDAKFNEDEKGRIKKGISDIELKDSVRAENIRCYRESKSFIIASADDDKGLFFDNMDLNVFWLDRISDSVEKLFDHRLDGIREYKLTKGYLSEKVWKDLINYLSIKYIAIGKAVYNAATQINEDGTVEIGEIASAYKEGISSFDYELIKAEEQLQREISVYVSFAVNNLSRAVIDRSKKRERKEEDILSLKEARLNEVAYYDANSRILQYFGGKSKWEDIEQLDRNSVDLTHDLSKILGSMRNESFHFLTVRKDRSSWNQDLISAMFEHDVKAYGGVLKNKFYSNNLPMFYKTENLEETLHQLYEKPSNRASQIPSFNKVLVRGSFPVYLREAIGGSPAFEPEVMMKWQGAVYYLLKEIYYNEFINSEQAKLLFLEASRKIQSDNNRAADDFRKKLNDIKQYSLPEICQIIMTEQNQQNQGAKKKKSSESEKKAPSIFKHYKLLLYMCLRQAFTEYWSQKYTFIKGPVLKDKPDENKFIPDFKCGRYDRLADNVRLNPDLQRWYILSRMINPRQANQLAGSLRSYIQYTWDIQRRAKETGNKVHNNSIKETTEMLKTALEIIDVSIQMAGTTSNCISDYFIDEDEFAGFVSNYLDTDDGMSMTGISMGTRLKEFCNREMLGDRIGIFYDGANPIMNRNIIMAKMFSDNELLSKMLENSKVTYDDLFRLRETEKKIAGYKVSGACSTRKAREELSEFQNFKNHVEFRDLMEYTELIDELQGQLINWTYMRERDLLYFQLGFHYTCLKNGNFNIPQYSRIDLPDGKRIDNAILYQILAMYTNGLRVYDLAEKSKNNASLSPGGKFKAFAQYSKTIYKDDPSGEAIYSAGLELFENIKEHENISELRNYIDHFKYYENHDRSLLNIYSEMFDRFFSYDNKYRKNAINIFYNILLQHFVLARFRFGTGTKKVGLGDNAPEKYMAELFLSDFGGLSSERFTYKLKDDTRVTMFARGEQFLNNVATILYFPHKVPESVIEGIKETREKELTKITKEDREDAASERKGKNRRDTYKSGYSSNKNAKTNNERKPEPEGETAFQRAFRQAQERKAAGKK